MRREAAGSPQGRFMARQPIVDVDRAIVGYELLFRDGWRNACGTPSGSATKRTLDNLLYFGTENLTQGRLAFVNCTREALVDRLVLLLPPGHVVLEVLETVDPTPELVNACVELRKMGYLLALDDFEPKAGMEPLVEIADFIKVDFRLSGPEQRQRIREMAMCGHAAMLAEKIEDENEFKTALDEGYIYFQGYFFSKPAITSRRTIPANRLNYLRLMSELARNPLDLEAVSRIVQMEASLSYRLLKLAHSPLWGRRDDVTSIREACLLVGDDRFRMLVSVAASWEFREGGRSALIALSTERARFCELMAPLLGESPTEQFMLGMLSLVDAMLDIPMESVADTLPLRPEARAALLGDHNSTALALCLVRAIEAGNFELCEEALTLVEGGSEQIAGLYIEAVRWASLSLDQLT